MTTAKEVLNGPAVPPSFLESVFSKFKSPVAPPDPDAQLHNREPLKPETSDLPSPAAAQAPATSDDHRCKFSFSDGRQCRMPRAAHHDYLCAHHASKEAAESGAISFPELEALCADLTSATNINRAVTHVFLLLAQGRVTERQALCFASLARLLLRTIPDLHDEWIGVLGTRAYAEKLKAKLLASPPAPPEETAKPRPQNAVPAANPAGLQPRRDQPVPITPPSRPIPISIVRSAPAAPVSSRPETSSVAPADPRSPAVESSACASAGRSPIARPPLPANPVRSEDALGPDRAPTTSSIGPTPSANTPPNSVYPRPVVPTEEPRLVWIERLQGYVPESGL